MMCRRRSHPILACAVVVFLAGCGVDPHPDAEAPGRLVVHESLPPEPRYIEGSLSFLRVVRTSSGEIAVDGARTDGLQTRGRYPLFSGELEPGEYRLVSYQRPCAGNCEQLDPPTDRCEATVDVRSGKAVALTVVLGQRGGCTIRYSSRRGDKLVSVPDIVGMPRTRATCALGLAGLRWRFRGDRKVLSAAKPTCEQQRAGGVAVQPDPTVREQTPNAGRHLRPGELVRIEDDCTALRGTGHGCG